MPRYALTIEGDTLAELTGRLTEMAATLQAGDVERAVAAELAPLAEDPRRNAPAPVDNGARPAAIPTPAPDYQAAGLTAWQEAQVRANQPEPIYVPPQAAVAVLPPAPDTAVAEWNRAYAHAPEAQKAPQDPYTPPAGTVPQAPPQCRLGHGAMLWKGGGLSKNGKGLPLWSCEGDGGKCREAIWPPR